MRKTLLQTILAAFCAILAPLSQMGGGGMIAAHHSMLQKAAGGVKFIAGVDNNAVGYNYNTGSGIYDNAAVINTGVVADLSTRIEYSAWLYPIGTRTSGYVTGVYFGALMRDDANDSFWARGFVPSSEDTANIQARIGSRASSFSAFQNTSLSFHVLTLSRNDGFCIDNVQMYSMSTATFGTTPRYAIYLGGANLAGRPWRCYRQIITDVKITNNGGVDMHLKPAIVNDVVGMVDVNNDNLFYSSATNIGFTESQITQLA